MDAPIHTYAYRCEHCGRSMDRGEDRHCNKASAHYRAMGGKGDYICEPEMVGGTSTPSEPAPASVGIDPAAGEDNGLTARDKEAARIVAFLRAHVRVTRPKSKRTAELLDILADAIERGEHRKEGR